MSKVRTRRNSDYQMRRGSRGVDLGRFINFLWLLGVFVFRGTDVDDGDRRGHASFGLAFWKFLFTAPYAAFSLVSSLPATTSELSMLPPKTFYLLATTTITLGEEEGLV